MLKNLGFIIALLVIYHVSDAQNIKDTVSLDTLTIRASAINQFSSGKTKVLDKKNIYRHQILSDITSLHSALPSLYIKSYGQGGISTPSFRGTAAHHTQVNLGRHPFKFTHAWYGRYVFVSDFSMGPD